MSALVFDLRLMCSSLKIVVIATYVIRELTTIPSDRDDSCRRDRNIKKNPTNNAQYTRYAELRLSSLRIQMNVH